MFKSGVRSGRPCCGCIQILYLQDVPLAWPLALGVPAIYTEAAGAGRVSASVVDCFVRGVTNVMRYLGMLDSSAESCPCRVSFLVVETLM